MKILLNYNKLVCVLGILALSLLFAGCSITSESFEVSRAKSSPAAHVMHAPAHASGALPPAKMANFIRPNYDTMNRERYSEITETGFVTVLDKPLSTFSVDVDTAAYSNVRRFIDRGQLPPSDAVRIEELINYFDYQYPPPVGRHPFSITTEVGPAPWNTKHKLVHIGLKGQVVDESELPPANLVFLIDVSGSMHSRLPLVKSSMKLITKKMRPQDSVAIVVYAGAAGLVLEPTTGDFKAKINAAIDDLQAGGSTAGGAGIELAYRVAQRHFKTGGNNRIILATDGDFNVGASSVDELKKLIEEKRKSGVFLTVLGFGMGNYHDALAETLANKGNGNYAYIDTMQEAKKTLVTEFGGSMLTIAKDVKIQVQFNPAHVASYRLIGYENRRLNNEDFANDKKDAGEIGSGHTVTAIYEIIPRGAEDEGSSPRYVQQKLTPAKTDELMFVQFRYKKPDEDTSQLIKQVVKLSDDQSTSRRFIFSAAVAEFGMLLRDSAYKGNASYEQVIELARKGKGEDKHGYRSGFINLVETAREIKHVSKSVN